MKAARMLCLSGLMLLILLPLGAQEGTVTQSRREVLNTARMGLLEGKVFSPEELLALEQAKEKARLAGEIELAEDFTSLIFAAGRRREAFLFQQDAERKVKEAWDLEVRRRELESNRGLMNVSAGTSALVAAGSLLAGFAFYQLSNQAFLDYATSTVNSPESREARASYQTYERLSYGFMFGAIGAALVSVQFMFLQN